MCKQPWQVAELLEEIAHKADPLLTVKRRLGLVPGYQMRSDVGLNVESEAGSDPVTFSYSFEIAEIMKDVDGTIDEVVELARTGLAPNQTIWLENVAGTEIPLLWLKVMHDDPDLKRDLDTWTKRAYYRSIAALDMPQNYHQVKILHFGTIYLDHFT